MRIFFYSFYSLVFIYILWVRKFKKLKVLKVNGRDTQNRLKFKEIIFGNQEF
jgi:hypothetical protein